MEYIDWELMQFIERPDISKIVDYWVSVWEETLHGKFMLGAYGSKIKHQIRIVGSQIVVITTSSTVEEPIEMRLRLIDRNFDNPEFRPIPSDEWYHPKEDNEIN
jgi:hypothetical protein